MKNKKAQSWYIDYIIGFLIFFGGIMLAMNFLPNTIDNNYDEIILEAEMLSDSIMSQGIPPNWNSTNVTTPGVLTNNFLDTDKLLNLYNITYEDTRLLYNLKNNFYIYFEKDNIIQNISNKTIYGKTPEDQKHILHKKRIIPYDGDILILNVVVWK